MDNFDTLTTDQPIKFDKLHFTSVLVCSKIYLPPSPPTRCEGNTRRLTESIQKETTKKKGGKKRINVHFLVIDAIVVFCQSQQGSKGQQNSGKWLALWSHVF